MYIVRYFNCEGRHSYLHATHLKFLTCLRHDNWPLNVPHFMYHILLKRVAIVQKGTLEDISQDFFIKLIIEKSLREQIGISWDDFILNNVQNPIR